MDFNNIAMGTAIGLFSVFIVILIILIAIIVKIVEGGRELLEKIKTGANKEQELIRRQAEIASKKLKSDAIRQRLIDSEKRVQASKVSLSADLGIEDKQLALSEFTFSDSLLHDEMKKPLEDQNAFDMFN